MYITYETAQYSLDDDGRYARRCQPFKKVPNTLVKPEFMPTKLVRISDMATVDGSQVNEGYCALSYSWNQSGKIYYNPFRGKHSRIDKAKHRIIYDENSKEQVRYVRFEGIIQQICQQFNIQYIWFDQMCINQDDKEEKKREICNMHHIYSYAYCAVAIVPEYKEGFNLDSNYQEYFKRLWTLEEAVKSERILFVGSNRHIWGEDISAHIPLYQLIKPLSKLRVPQILYYAHQRTSTKEHDRVFALINLFPDIMQHIDIDYDQPLEDLMVQFYGHLAKEDISILLFGDIRNYTSVIQKYSFLPSWTGVHGEHLVYDVTTSFQSYNIIGKTMHVTSEFASNDQSIGDDALAITQKEDLPPPPVDINNDNNQDHYRLCILVQLPGARETRRIQVTEHSYSDIFEKEKRFEQISKKLKQLSRFMDIKKNNLYWCHWKRVEYKMVAVIDLNRLTEDMNDSAAQYVILSEVFFDGLYYIVIKKKQGKKYYRAIGCCRIDYTVDFFSDCKLPKQTFLIQ